MSAPAYTPDKLARRLAGFSAAVKQMPWLAERLARGQQFNAYEDADNDEDDEDEDLYMHVCIGPITDCARILTVTGRAKAELIADALTAAALSKAVKS